MIESSFFQVYPKHEFFMLVLRNHFLRFLLFFFFSKCSPKLECILYMGLHYTQVNMVLTHGKVNRNPNFPHEMNK